MAIRHIESRGHERDAGSLDYMHARYYSAAQGRFLGIDPAETAEGGALVWNRYTCVIDNPIRLIDMDGETFWESAYGVAQGFLGSATLNLFEVTRPTAHDSNDQRFGQIVCASTAGVLAAHASAQGAVVVAGGLGLTAATAPAGGEGGVVGVPVAALAF